jgi:hypothetical protein
MGYFGIGPGLELVPYFLALMGFVGAALLAVVQWPLQALIHRISRRGADPQGDVNSDQNEEPGEGNGT